MNYGALIFLAAFFALSSSWFTFVLKPSVQVGHLQQTNVLGGTTTYPVARPGLAQRGLDVYRANGCLYCHSQQVGQSATILEAVLMEQGTNPPATIEALLTLLPNLSETDANTLLADLPKPVYRGTKRSAMETAVRTLNASGAKAVPWVMPAGADIARGWGKRRTVAEDFLFDRPVMPGSQRVGPDLANVGARLPDPNWHLRHLYAPRMLVKGSTMPPYRYLFEERKIGRAPSPDALQLTEDYAPPSGYEVVPKPEALALTAYLLSLKANAPLSSAPMTVAIAPQGPGQTGTNAPTESATTNPAAIENPSPPTPEQ
jgi:cbb3-type cytochrome oxidase cytochrome c subunit